MHSLDSRNEVEISIVAAVEGLKVTQGAVDYERRQVEFVASNLLILPSPPHTKRPSSSTPDLTSEADELEHHWIKQLDIEKRTNAHWKQDYAKLKAECKRLRESNATIASNFYSSSRMLVEGSARVEDVSGHSVFAAAKLSLSNAIGAMELRSKLEEEKQISAHWRKLYEKLQATFNLRDGHTVPALAANMITKAQLDSTNLRSQLAAELQISSKLKSDYEQLKATSSEVQRKFNALSKLDAPEKLLTPLILESAAQQDPLNDCETKLSSVTKNPHSIDFAKSYSDADDKALPLQYAGELFSSITVSMNTAAATEPRAAECAEMLMQLATKRCSTSMEAKAKGADNIEIDERFAAEINDLKRQLLTAKEGTSKHDKPTMVTQKESAPVPRLFRLKWMERFNKLKEFHCIHGHCYVRQVQDPVLNRWVNNQRNFLQLYEGYKMARIDALNSLGYTWGAGHPLEGGVSITPSIASNEHIGNPNPSLASHDGDGEYTNNLADANLQKYEATKSPNGFCESTAYAFVRPREVGMGKQAAQWIHFFERLKLFQENNGHCNVPKQYNPALSNWAAIQRHRLTEYTQKGYRKMRIDALNSIGYSWGLHRYHPLDDMFPIKTCTLSLKRGRSTVHLNSTQQIGKKTKGNASENGVLHPGSDRDCPETYSPKKRIKMEASL